MSTPDWTVTCPRCGRTFDSMDSLADSKDMLRTHMQRTHAATPDPVDGPANFAYSRARCARCDHRRKDHDGDNGICARFVDPDCACAGFEEPPTGSQDEDGDVWERFRYGWRKDPDVAPDEALAKAICRSLDFPESSMLGQAVTAAVKDVLAAGWFPDVERLKRDRETDRLQINRLTQERDTAEARCERLSVLAEKWHPELSRHAADVERLTRERNEARDALDILVKRQTDDQSRIERLIEERDTAEDHHKALREDVDRAAEQATNHSDRLADRDGDVEHKGCAVHAKRELLGIVHRDEVRTTS